MVRSEIRLEVRIGGRRIEHVDSLNLHCTTRHIQASRTTTHREHLILDVVEQLGLDSVLASLACVVRWQCNQRFPTARALPLTHPVASGVGRPGALSRRRALCFDWESWSAGVLRLEVRSR